MRLAAWHGSTADMKEHDTNCPPKPNPPLKGRDMTAASSDSSTAGPSTTADHEPLDIATALPADVLNHVARLLGFRGWQALKYFGLLERAVLVPDGAPTINAAINAAGHHGHVLIRPGVYTESVRVTRDLTIAGLGPPGSVVVQPPGWEAAFVWGGYSVGVARVGGTVHQAASAGAHAVRHRRSLPMPPAVASVERPASSPVHSLSTPSAAASQRVCNVTVRLRNQQQQTAVYISSGAPSISDCDIQGTVHVAGPRCAPSLSRRAAARGTPGRARPGRRLRATSYAGASAVQLRPQPVPLPCLHPCGLSTRLRHPRRRPLFYGRCVIRSSRGFGLRCADHALGTFTDVEIRDCKRAGNRLDGTWAAIAPPPPPRRRAAPLAPG